MPSSTELTTLLNLRLEGQRHFVAIGDLRPPRSSTGSRAYPTCFGDHYPDASFHMSSASRVPVHSVMILRIEPPARRRENVEPSQVILKSRLVRDRKG